MPKIPSITERELSSLSPRALDEDFMTRLAACTDGSSLELSDAELEFEASLRAFSPRTVPAPLSATLAEAISDTPFAVDEKIVLFHKSGGRAAKRSYFPRIAFRSNVAAAAAVALFGAIAALMLPNHGGDAGDALSDQVPDRSVVVPPLITRPYLEKSAPATMYRKLPDTRAETEYPWDEIIIVPEKNE